MAFGKKKVRVKEIEEFNEEDYNKDIETQEEVVEEVAEPEIVQEIEEVEGGFEETKPKEEELQEVKKNFEVFASSARLGIINVKTKEIIAEGELAQLKALAEILERLDRIEKLAEE